MKTPAIAGAVSEGDAELVPTFSAANSESAFRPALIEFYCECVAGEMLPSICVTDAIFDSLCHELAGHLGIRVSEASALLWPTRQRIYQAAKAASCE